MDAAYAGEYEEHEYVAGEYVEYTGRLMIC